MRITLHESSKTASVALAGPRVAGENAAVISSGVFASILLLIALIVKGPSVIGANGASKNVCGSWTSWEGSGVSLDSVLVS
jgi:hypothetical protein